jgi:hypothetical protein
VPEYVIKTDDVVKMADAFIFVCDYANEQPDSFTFGPFNEQMLMVSGLHLIGDTDKVAADLTRTVKGLEVEKL